MTRPIQSGDICEVVGGLGQGRSPNLGLRVKVGAFQGEHSTHGRIWRCTGEGIKQLGDGGEYVTTGWGDFAQAWLRRIEPDAPPPAADEVKREIAA